MKAATELYRLLGDGARLRMLRLLSLERLNVSELTQVLGLAQSGVSRHLGLLRQAGLVQEAREGGFAYYTAGPTPALADVWTALERHFADAAEDAAVKADDARLGEVQRARKERFAAHGTEFGQLVPGRSWAAWGRALGLLLPPWRVADVGCGEGYLTVETARWAAHVVAVDRSPDVLARARALATRRGVTNVSWEVGEIEQLPLADASVDVVLLSQALHHAEDPSRALAEAYRVVAPGGRVLILDLRAHDQGWVRDRLDDRWLGFEDRALTGFLATAGFTDIRTATGASLADGPFAVVLATGTKP
ncbi:MAG: metalloregulator ArsR/SmtB family transcription factor [Vicinamibacteraceae bacterium]